MALSRISAKTDFAFLFAKSTAFTASSSHPPPPLHRTTPGRAHEAHHRLHAGVARHYPAAPLLPLPHNVSEILNIETSRFAPERARDIGGLLRLTGTATAASASSTADAAGSREFHRHQHQRSEPQQQQYQHYQHHHRRLVDSYDCSGAVSLSGSMQSTVPKPFRSGGRSTYLNMPGGSWARDGKYLAEVMRKGLHLATVLSARATAAGQSTRNYATDAKAAKPPSSANNERKIDREFDDLPMYEEMTKQEKFKILLKNYGMVIMVFHVGISLISLAVCYVIVSSGLDLEPMIRKMVGEDGEMSNKFVNNIMNKGSTFLIAYAFHKMFAPMRFSITIASTPFIVRFLRRRGIFEPLYKVNK